MAKNKHEDEERRAAKAERAARKAERRAAERAAERAELVRALAADEALVGALRAGLAARLADERARDRELVQSLRAAAGARPDRAELDARLAALRAELAERWSQERARLDGLVDGLVDGLARRLAERAAAPAADEALLPAAVEARLRESREQDLRHREALFARAARWVGLPLAAALVAVGALGLRALADLRALAGAVAPGRAPAVGALAEGAEGGAEFPAADRAPASPDAVAALARAARGDDPDAAARAVDGLAVFAAGDAPPAARARAVLALAAVEAGGAPRFAAQFAAAADDAHPLLAAAGLRALARRFPDDPRVARAAEPDALAALETLSDFAPRAALLLALAAGPPAEPEARAAARSAALANLLGRALCEPFRPAARGAALELGLRGPAPGAAPLALGEVWRAPAFQAAVDALLGAAAAQPTLAALHARVDRLTCPDEDGARPFVVTVAVEPGAALAVRGGAALAGPRAELTVRAEALGARLAARALDAQGGAGPWQTVEHLVRPEALAFGLAPAGGR